MAKEINIKFDIKTIKFDMFDMFESTVNWTPFLFNLFIMKQFKIFSLYFADME